VHDFEILEKEVECGGLCRTLVEHGFTFDYGGCHIIFSKDDGALNFILNSLGKNRVRNRRNSKVLYKGHYIKYPFENGLSDLPKEDNFECLYYFLQMLTNREQLRVKPPQNFKEWCYYTFGKGIAEKYLVPYNEKIWKLKTEGMDVNWVTDRVPQPPMEDVIKSSLGIETEGYTHQLYFYYPSSGGIQSLIKVLEKEIEGRITTGFKVMTLGRDNGKWLVSNGRVTKAFDKIVSTIPIFALADALGDIPKEVGEAISRLKYNRLITVMLGLDIPKVNDFTWLYIPDPSVLPHRLGFLSNFSQGNAAPGKSSILAEITCSLENNSIWRMADSEIINRVIEDLCQLGIIGDKNRICYTSARRSAYAYVIYVLDYQRNIKVVKDFFRSLGITLVGRFSEFEYLNMDACVRHAMQVAEGLNSNEQ
jgi:protoporphyrinogen oxidase